MKTPRKRPTASSRKRFLDPARIDSALAVVAEIVTQEHIKVALAGGVALQLYGSDRFTADLDVVADRYPITIKRRGTLTFGGVKTSLASVPVDFIVRDDQYADLYDDAIRMAGRMSGVPVPVVTLPYLAAMKMAAGRGKDEQDLRFILTGAGRSTGASYQTIRATVTQYLGLYAGDELDALHEIAKWEAKTGNRSPRKRTR